MENFEETRPSLHLASFASSSFKNSLMDNLSDDPKKLSRRHPKIQTPFRELLTSRGNNFLTPRTQLTSFSTSRERDLGQSSDNLSKIRDEIKCSDSIIDSTLDDEFKDFPTLKWCAYCCREVCTEIYYKNSSKTFWSSLGIFLAGGVCGCFMLPYMMNSCKEITSRCSRCKHELNAITEE